jgi:hypothetical protein
MAVTAGTDARQNNGSGGCLGVLGRAFLAFLLLGILVGAGAAAAMGAGSLAAATGVTGTPGRITISSCALRHLNSRSKDTTCTGSFVSSDGHERDLKARVGGGKPGEVASVRKTGDHTYERTGPAAVSSSLSELLFGVFLLHAFVLGSMAALRRKRKSAAPSWRSLAWTGGALGLAVLVQLVIHLAG